VNEEAELVLTTPTLGDLGWLKAQVIRIYEVNHQIGYASWCDDSFNFTCPSSATYPFQWFWDSCFHAIVLSHIDIAKAEAELFSLVANQHPDGFISHVTFWQRDSHEEMISTYDIAYRSKYLSDEIQPPLLAEAVLAIAQRGRGTEFLAEILPSVDRFYEWLDTTRNPFKDGLIRIVQPDESGLDHSPIWDELMHIEDEEKTSWIRGWHFICDPYDLSGRDPKSMIELNYFVVANVMMNSIYIENLRTLSELFTQVDDSYNSTKYRKRAELARKSLDELCWDETDGLYYDVNGMENVKIRVNTFSSLMPVLLSDLDPSKFDRLLTHILDPNEYWSRFPIPSVAMNHPTYRPDTVGGNLVWRGPTWINSNWYIARGLMRHGRSDLARHIAARSVDLMRLSGIREYYNPHTGQGHGAPDFSWSTILYDLLIEVL
jgi:hypothetical protein